jgi:hypothetical protein
MIGTSAFSARTEFSVTTGGLDNGDRSWQGAQARGVRLGRPRTVVDAAKIVALRAAGASWREVSDQMGIGVGTAVRALQQALQKPKKLPPASS